MVDLSGLDIVLFFVGLVMLKVQVFCFVVVGVMVIDNLLVWCKDFDVLLVVFEVNFECDVYCWFKGIIVNLNCIIMVVMLVFKVLYDEV